MKHTGQEKRRILKVNSTLWIEWIEWIERIESIAVVGEWEAPPGEVSQAAVWSHRRNCSLVAGVSGWVSAATRIGTLVVGYWYRASTERSALLSGNGILWVADSELLLSLLIEPSTFAVDA
ncbi:uncharacterized protein LOC112493906 [Cephus cinctus]|uniref:Uncharacterized protein LOC112493906 n=1 Tax=Cephus cinctus TaxID=211228 RepID=A0AAJ7VYD7_CEPCN|nr:uncharacterized protein LOC112493906 [Cephus cinctus]